MIRWLEGVRPDPPWGALKRSEGFENGRGGGNDASGIDNDRTDAQGVDEPGGLADPRGRRPLSVLETRGCE